MALYEQWYPNDDSNTTFTSSGQAMEVCHCCGGESWVKVNHLARCCPVCGGKGWIYPDLVGSFHTTDCTTLDDCEWTFTQEQ